MTLNRLNVFSHPLLDLRASLPADRRQFLGALKNKVTFERIVARREVQTLEYKGERIISDLFDAFVDRPLELVGEEAFDASQDGLSHVLGCSRKSGGWQQVCDEATQFVIARSISDFIAGMTNHMRESSIADCLNRATAVARMTSDREPSQTNPPTPRHRNG